MRASEFINEDIFGTNPKRAGRHGARDARGHKETSCYKNKDNIEYEDEIELDEAGKTAKKVCLSKKSDGELGASQLSSCKAQGLRKRDTDRKFKIGKGTKKIKGTFVKSSDYGGPLPKWKGNE